ncbi:MAG: hypothetical protein ACT4QG_01340 [Sporichthyaceae bacterium]
MRKGRRKSTREGRRLFAGCALFGVVLGVVADVLVVTSFAGAAQYVQCNPNDPTDYRSCPELDVVGFALNSKTEAALTVGPIVAFVAFVLCVVAVLVSSEPRRDH